MHRAFYESRPEAGAVVHLHSTMATAVACLPDVDAAIAAADALFRHAHRPALPVLPYYRPGDPAMEPGDRRTPRGTRAPCCWPTTARSCRAATLTDAVYAAEELEEAARLFLLLRTHAPRLLTSPQGRRPARHISVTRHEKGRPANGTPFLTRRSLTRSGRAVGARRSHRLRLARGRLLAAPAPAPSPPSSSAPRPSSALPPSSWPPPPSAPQPSSAPPRGFVAVSHLLRHRRLLGRRCGRLLRRHRRLLGRRRRLLHRHLGGRRLGRLLRCHNLLRRRLGHRLLRRRRLLGHRAHRHRLGALGIGVVQAHLVFSFEAVWIPARCPNGRSGGRFRNMHAVALHEGTSDDEYASRPRPKHADDAAKPWRPTDWMHASMRVTLHTPMLESPIGFVSISLRPMQPTLP